MSKEVRLGETARWSERGHLRRVTQDTDRIKPIENCSPVRSPAFGSDRQASSTFSLTDQPFGFDYSFDSRTMQKTAGDLLLVRPRVLGDKGSGLLETKEPRKFPVELEDGPVGIQIRLKSPFPPGYGSMTCPHRWTPITVLPAITPKPKRSKMKEIRYTRTFEVERAVRACGDGAKSSESSIASLPATNAIRSCSSVLLKGASV